MNSFFSWSVTSNATNISDEIASHFEKRMGIEFINTDQVEPNLCYIESEEVRDEYRTTFTQSDILYYIYAMQHSPYVTIDEKVFSGVNVSILYPKNSTTFWELARLGKELKQVGTNDSTLVRELIKVIAKVD
jgi:predicted helicase